ncbi:MAG: cytochrome c oxidase subunit II [Gemmatimonadetes bacterium]|nr:MAG: cytochrome c oxidase subunit II [Gemmatimonadota bacterium]
MGNGGSFWLPPASSTVAGEVDSIFYFVYYASVVLFILVIGLTAFFVFRYRRRGGTRQFTSGFSHSNVMEVTWTVIPTILVFVIFFWGFNGFLKMHVAPKDALQIKVTGQKWFWSFDYPSGASSVNEIVAPVNKPVELLMSSKDVIHSFYVPDFRVKMDVLPNRYTKAWFEATETGEYNLFCTEYCGTKHSEMIGKVKILSELDYQKWLEAADFDTTIALHEMGERLYKSKACVTCHSIDGTPMNGPSFKGIWGKTEHFADGSSLTIDENYIRESILNPNAKVVAGFQPIMPTYQGILKDRHIDAIIAYLKTLK